MTALLQHNALGQTARFERFAADMLWFIAAGRNIDMDKTPKFRDQVERVYSSRYRTEPKQMTAAEIKQHILDRIDDLLAEEK